jgi:hypothetical protein
MAIDESRDRSIEGAVQSTAPFDFSWDMSISRVEFERSLPDAVDNAAYHIDGQTFSHRADNRFWQITLEPLPDRVIALLRLPRHRVTFRFEGYDDVARAVWVERFKRYFQRGGG